MIRSAFYILSSIVLLGIAWMVSKEDLVLAAFLGFAAGLVATEAFD